MSFTPIRSHLQSWLKRNPDAFVDRNIVLGTRNPCDNPTLSNRRGVFVKKDATIKQGDVLFYIPSDAILSTSKLQEYVVSSRILSNISCRFLNGAIELATAAASQLRLPIGSDGISAFADAVSLAESLLVVDSLPSAEKKSIAPDYPHHWLRQCGLLNYKAKKVLHQPSRTRQQRELVDAYHASVAYQNQQWTQQLLTETLRMADEHKPREELDAKWIFSSKSNPSQKTQQHYRLDRFQKLFYNVISRKFSNGVPPWMDFVNHPDAYPTSENQNVVGQANCDSFLDESGGCGMIARRDIEGSEEIYAEYGTLSNSILMTNFGFAPRANPYGLFSFCVSHDSFEELVNKRCSIDPSIILNHNDFNDEGLASYPKSNSDAMNGMPWVFASPSSIPKSFVSVMKWLVQSYPEEFKASSSRSNSLQYKTEEAVRSWMKEYRRKIWPFAESLVDGYQSLDAQTEEQVAKEVLQWTPTATEVFQLRVLANEARLAKEAMSTWEKSLEKE